MIPNKQQYKKWSLPSKYTFIALIIGLIGLFLGVFGIWYAIDSNSSNNKKFDKLFENDEIGFTQRKQLLSHFIQPDPDESSKSEKMRTESINDIIDEFISGNYDKKLSKVYENFFKKDLEKSLIELNKIQNSEKKQIDEQSHELRGRLLLINKQYEKSIQEYLKSYNLTPTYAKARRLGLLYFNLYRYPQADQYLEYAEKFLDNEAKSDSIRKLIAVNKCDLASTNIRLENIDFAEIKFKESLRIHEELYSTYNSTDKLFYAYALGNYAAILDYRHMFKESLNRLKKAKEIVQSLDSESLEYLEGISTTYLSIGESYTASKDHQNAILYLNNAYDNYTLLGDTFGHYRTRSFIACCRNLATNYIEIGDKENSKRYINLGFEWIEKGIKRLPKVYIEDKNEFEEILRQID